MQGHDSNVIVEMGLSPLLYTSGAVSCRMVCRDYTLTLCCMIGVCCAGLTRVGVDGYNIYIQTASQHCVFSVFGGMTDGTCEQSQICDLPVLCEENGKHSRKVESEGSVGNKSLSSSPVNLTCILESMACV